MSETIIAAIITGAATIIGTILILFRDTLPFIFSRTRRKLKGTWRGEVRDINCFDVPEGKDLFSYSIELELKQIGRFLYGNASGQNNQGVRYKHKVRGFIESDDYMTLIARSPKSNIRDFGVSFCRIHGDANTIVGYSLFNSMQTPGIVLIQGTLNKVPE